MEKDRPERLEAALQQVQRGALQQGFEPTILVLLVAEAAANSTLSGPEIASLVEMLGDFGHAWRCRSVF